MSNLEALYQEVILDHNRKPRNFREIADADHIVDGKNPNCGDQLRLFLKLEGDKVADVSFTTPPGVGCAISKASASLMTSSMKGKTRREAEDLFARFHDMLIGKLDEVERAKMGSLGAFGGVSKFPARVKCASLAWHAFKSALDGGGEVTTEGEGPALTQGA